MSKNELRIVRYEDFKKTVETGLGYPLRSQDVDVVSIYDKPLADKIGTINLSEMIFKMLTFNKENGITAKDVAVISQEELMREESADNINHGNNVISGTNNTNNSTGSKRKIGK